MDQLTAQIEFKGSEAAEGEKPSRRRFRMTGYTGAKVRSGRLAFATGGFQHKAKVPILLEHDPAKRIGYADRFEVVGGELQLEGYLLRNKYAREVAQDSDDGFPFEASVGLSEVDWEHLEAGESAELNGSSVDGPLSIGRTARLSEVSFCCAGADSRTEAVALNKSTTEAADMAANDSAVALIAEKDAQLAALTTKLGAATARADAAETQLAEVVKANEDADQARRERAASDYVEQLQAKATEAQSPIPADDLERVALAFAKGDDSTAKALGSAYLSRSEALAGTAALTVKPIGATTNDQPSHEAFLSAVLAKVGVDPSNPHRIKV